MKRKRLSAFALAGIAAMVLAACSSSGGKAASGSSPTDTAGAGTGTGTQQTTAIKIAVFPSFNGLMAYAALANGSFKDQGLDVTIQTVNTPTDSAPLLDNNTIQFGLMDMTTPILAASKQKNPPYLLVAPGAVERNPDADGWSTGNVWVKKGSPITSVKDLTGKKFSIPSINSQAWLSIREMIDNAGGDSSKVQWVQIPDAQSSFAQLRAGSVDATTSAEPNGSTLATDSSLTHLAAMPGVDGLMAYSFVATPSYVAKNADVIKRFQAAMLNSNKLLNTMSTDDKAALAATVNKAWTLDILKGARYPKYGEALPSDNDVQTWVDRMKKYGMLDANTTFTAADLLAKTS